ncbi:MAG: redox-sensing transcriptional repressor Rex [Planctomycetota bacterium]|nr:redox-sensing transcriptional repressor Rex [Planctomycetota bacterium]
MANKNDIIRLSRYKNALIRLRALNFVKVFSDNLADATGVSAIQVRRDFSTFDISGNRRGGYEVDELIKRLNKILDKDTIHKFIEVGAGNLGKALLRYPGFAKSGIKIVACFDVDPAKYDRGAEIPVLPIEELDDFVRKHQVRFGIISTPDLAAQQVLVRMISSGIKGVLNFASIYLRGPQYCVINNVNLESEIENIVYFVNLAGESQ